MLALQTHEVTSTDVYGAVFVFVVGWVVQFLIQWGAARQQAKHFSERIDKLEEKIDDNVLPRREYEARHQDLTNRVSTLEETAFLRRRSGDH